MSTTEKKTSAPQTLVPSLRSGGKALGIIPQTFDDCYKLAKCASIARVVPSGHDSTPEAVTMVVLFGLELGIPPMQSIQGITKINGKFCIYGDLVPALLWSHGFDIDQRLEGEGESMKAVCTITRPGGKQITRTFSVAQAKTAQLWGKNVWKTFPERMLGWRALGFAKSDGAADVMRGMSIIEVERDITPELPRNAVAGQTTLDVPDDILSANQVSEAETSQDAPLANVAEYLRLLGERLEAAENLEAFDEVWEAHEQLVEAGRMTPDAVRQAEILCEKHSERFAISGKPA